MDIRKQAASHKFKKNSTGLLDITDLYLNSHTAKCPSSKQKYTDYREAPRKERKSSVTLNRSSFEEISQKINTSILTDQFTSKIILIKKLQKLQKEAVNFFYEKKVALCFQNISKCFSLMGEFELQNDKSCENQEFFIEHLVYLRYLQTQLYFKLGDFKKSRKQYNSALSVLNKMKKALSDKVMNYQMNLRALHAMLLYEEKYFMEALKNIDNFERIYLPNSEHSLEESKITNSNQTRIIPSESKNKSRGSQAHSQEKDKYSREKKEWKPSGKTVKQLQYYRFAALVALKQSELAAELIKRFLIKYTQPENDQSQNPAENSISIFSVINSPYNTKSRDGSCSKQRKSEVTDPTNSKKDKKIVLTLSEKWKALELLSVCNSDLRKQDQNEKLLLSFIEEIEHNFQDKLTSEAVELLDKAFTLMVKNFESYDLIKSIFWAEKWKIKVSEINTVEGDQMLDRVNCKLFTLYAQISDYDSAVLAYSQLSQKYKKKWIEEYLIAQIYIFFGQKQSGMMALERASQLIEEESDDDKREYGQLKIQINFLKLEASQFSEGIKQRVRKIQKRIKQNMKKTWAKEILTIYEEFLLVIGEGERFRKFCEVVEKRNSESKNPKNNQTGEQSFMKTGEFGLGYDESKFSST